MEFCKICNREFKNLRAISNHLKFQHNYKLLNYKLEYENFKIPKCKFCDNSVSYTGRALHFCKTCCSVECRHKMQCEYKMTPKLRQQVSERMKKTRAEIKIPWKGFKKSEDGMSYPERFFKNIFDSEFNDKNYKQEYPMGRYLIDFAWEYKKLAIEIDGSQHEWEDRKLSDIKKDKLLHENGWKVMRIKWKDVYNNLRQWVQLAKDFIDDENYSETNYMLYIYENYSIELDVEYLKNKLGFEIQKSKKGNRIYLRNQGEIDEKINLILNSNIDFSQYGWVNEIAQILNITPQNVHKWMKRNMLEFYNTQCFKRKIK